MLNERQLAATYCLETLATVLRPAFTRKHQLALKPLVTALTTHSVRRAQQCHHGVRLVFGALLAVTHCAGCHYHTAQTVEYRVQQLNAVPTDLSPGGAAADPSPPGVPPAPASENEPPVAPAAEAQLPALPAAGTFDASAAKFAASPLPDSPLQLASLAELAKPRNDGGAIQLTSAQEAPRRSAIDRFVIPPELPGVDAAPIQLPPFNPSQTQQQHREQVRQLYSELPPIPASGAQAIQSSPEKGLTLTDLQQLAFDNSPVLRQAAAEVERRRGLALQAGMYPNPEAGYQADTANTADTDGYQGGFVAQEFVTANKLQLGQTALTMEQRAAELALRRAQVTLSSDVRRSYFDVLIALEKIKLARALAQLTGDVYHAQIGLVEGGEAAPYEPLQLRVFAMQTRNAMIQFENEYMASWRALAATVGMPGLPPTRLAGSLEWAAPEVDYENALAYLLANHTDLAISQARIAGAGYNLELQRVTPVPNVNVQTSLFYDDTSTLNDTAYSLQIGLPLPVFNRNRGNIIAAEAGVIRSRQDLSDTRNQLTARLAEAYGRYAASRQIVDNYRQSILPDQMRTYRGIYTRFLQVGEDVDFAQVVVSQQTLFDALREYVDALSEQWDSAVEVARVVQINDLYAMDRVIGPLEAEPLHDSVE